MRRAAKTDANQDEIVEALRAIGATVDYIKEPCDLLVGYRGVNYLLEVKDAAGKFTPRQRVWHREWKGKAHVVRCVEDALLVVR